MAVERSGKSDALEDLLERLIGHRELRLQRLLELRTGRRRREISEECQIDRLLVRPVEARLELPVLLAVLEALELDLPFVRPAPRGDPRTSKLRRELVASALGWRPSPA